MSEDRPNTRAEISGGPRQSKLRGEQNQWWVIARLCVKYLRCRRARMSSLETDKIVMRLHEILQMFGSFAGSLIWQNSK
jgi:hypothetical protein